jgi:hypothetical protein
LPACRTLQAVLEPDGSPLFVCKPLAACRRFEPRKRSRTLALAHPGVPSSPLRDRVDCFNHDRFRGYDTVHFRSGLLPPCLRFAVYVTGHHARLGARLLARLCRGRHLRRLTSIRLQGATLSELSVTLSRHSAPIRRTRRSCQAANARRDLRSAGIAFAESGSRGS